MTRAHRDANWSGVPSLSQLWLAALLRLVAMFVSNVAATLGMIGVLLSRDWHTKVEPTGLPQKTRDPTKENAIAAGSSRTTEALMVSSERSSRRVYPELVEGSNHEGVLISLSPLIPTKVGTQGGLQGLFRLRAAAPVQRKDRRDPWIPPPVALRPVSTKNRDRKRSRGAGTSGAVITLERTTAP